MNVVSAATKCPKKSAKICKKQNGRHVFSLYNPSAQYGDRCLLMYFFVDDVFRFSEVKEQHESLSRQQNPPAEMEAGTMEDLISSEQEVHIQDLSGDLSEDGKSVLLDAGDAEKEEDSERGDRTATQPWRRHQGERHHQPVKQSAERNSTNC